MNSFTSTPAAPPAIALTEEQLLDAHRELGHAVSFETIQRCPALLICLRNLAEIRQRRRLAPNQASDAGVLRTPSWRPATRPIFDGKRAAAHDLDD